MRREHSFLRGIRQAGIGMTGRILLIRLLLLLGLSLQVTSVCAEDFAPQIIRMGFTPSDGYLIEQKDRRLRGLVYDYTESLSNYANLRIVYVPCKQDECYQMLQLGKLDVVANVPAQDRNAAPLLSFSRHAISSTVINLTKRDRSAQRRQFDSTYRYGFDENILPRRVINESLAEIGQEEGSEYVLIPYADADMMYNDYRYGNIDGLVFDSSHTPADIKITSQLFRVKTYYAATKSHAYFLELLDDAADKLLLASPSYRESLYHRHLHHVQPLVLTDQEKLYLNSKKFFKILISPNQPPFSYFNDRGEPQGILPHILSLVEEDLGIKFVYQATSSYKEMLSALQSGDIDLVGDFNFSFNWAKENKLRLTLPFFVADYVAIQKRGKILPEQPRIACLEGYYFTSYIHRNIPHSGIINCQSYEDCLKAVNENRADVTFMQPLNARYAIEKGGFYSLYTTGAVKFSHPIAMALHKRTSPLMIEILNKELAHLRSQDLLSFTLGTELNDPVKQSLKRVIYDHPVASVLSLLGILFIVVGILVFFLKQQRAVARQAWQVLHYDAKTGKPNLTLFLEQLEAFLHRPARLQGAEYYVLSINSKQFDLMRDAMDDDHMHQGVAQVLSEMQQESPFLEFFGIDSERQLIHCLCTVPSNMSFGELSAMMRNRLSSFNYAGYSLHLNPNIGAIKVSSEYNAKDLVTYADITLREAILKHKPTQLYEQELFKNVVLFEKVQTLVSKALYNREFEILIQPKYAIKTHQCVGGEALVRWNSPELGHLTPGQFIEVLEKNGLILELDYFMLDEVSRLLSTWLQRGQTVVPLSVNHSGLHISEEGYLDKVRIIASKYQLPKQSLEIEITETAFVNYTTKSTREEAQEIITRLHELGYLLSIDDFCTGYSSIAMLQSLNVDILKIDSSILVEAHHSQRAAKVLENVVRLGEDINCKVLCEGIETVEDEEILIQSGCSYGQGYLFAKPMRIPQFEEFLKAHV